MVAGRINEDVALIPGTGLDTDVLMNGAQTLHLAVAYGDDCGRHFKDHNEAKKTKKKTLHLSLIYTTLHQYQCLFAYV